MVLYLLSTRLVRPTQRWKLSRREIIVTLALILVFSGAVGLAYLSSADRYENVGIFQAQPLPQPGIVEPAIIERVPLEEVPVIAPEQVPPTLSPYPVEEQAENAAVLEEDVTAAIYAAVVHEFYTVDHTYNIAPNFPFLYLLKTTDDTVGDPDAPKGESYPIHEVAQSLITDLLSGEEEFSLPAEIIWVETLEEVPFTDTGSIEDGGALIRLGNIFLQSDGSVMVSGSLDISALAATGKTYILNFIDGAWQVTGYTGVQWMR